MPRSLPTSLCTLLILSLSACGAGGAAVSDPGSVPTVAVTEPAEPVMISAVGGSVSITYTDEDADDVAETDLIADRDGNLATTADQWLIESGRLELDGTPQTLLWTPNGVAPGLYRILAVTRDATSEVIDEAPGVVVLNASPTLTIAEPSSDVIVSLGGSWILDIEYSDDDPDDTAITWITAELDCDPARVDLLGCATSGPRAEMDGVSQRLPLHVTPPSTNEVGVYSIVGTTWDGPNAPVTATAPGRVEVRNVAWARVAGGTRYPGSDKGQGIAAYADGSCVVTGVISQSTTFGTGEANETTLTVAGSRDAFVARYGGDGTLSWVKAAGGTSSTAGQGIATHADGSCVVTGYFSGSATFGAGEANETTLIAAGLSDAFLARYGADGTLSWTKAAGGTNYDQGEGIAAHADGACVVTGYFSDSATFGRGEANETTLTTVAGSPFGSYDVFVARYGADGTLSWTKAVGGTSNDQGGGIAAHADGSCVVTGFVSDGATFGAGEANETTLSAGMFVARYGADSTLSWVKTSDGTGFTRGTGIAALADGSCVVTGSLNTFSSSVTFGAGEANETTLDPAYAGGLFVARYGADGTLGWAKAAGGGGSTYSQGIADHPDGSFVVTGLFWGSDTIFGAGGAKETMLTAAADAVFVARYNADGGF